MLNNKSLLYGLGIGLITGALLLQLMMISNPSASKSLNPSVVPVSVSEMDRVQLKEAAAKYYQVFDVDQKMVSQTQVDSMVQQKVKEEKDKQATQQPPGKEAVKETYVYISSGLNAGNVGDLLFRSGVITDRKAFEDMMAQQQLNEKIVAGVHVFKGLVELASVVSNITSR
jgi:hypothetical protein